MPNPELVRPHWRCGAAYAEALPQEAVTKEIKNALLTNQHQKFPRKHDTPATELDVYFHSLIKDIRLIDFGQFTYWFAMLGLCFNFLLCELFIVRIVAGNPARLMMFQTMLIICISILAMLLIVWLGVCYRLQSHLTLPKPWSHIPAEWFQVIPVIWVSSSTVLLNFYLVTQTGYSDSPFLPALLASSLVVMSLPRENSKPVLCIAIVTLVLGVVAGYVTNNSEAVQETVSKDWGGQALAKQLNLLTFIYSGVSVIILRWIGNHKITQK